MSWQKITIYPERYSPELVFAIQDAFASAWALSGGPREAGLYFRSPVGVGVVEIFLSPKAAEIAKTFMTAFRPEPVDAPDLDTLEASLRHLKYFRPKVLPAQRAARRPEAGAVDLAAVAHFAGAGRDS